MNPIVTEKLFSFRLLVPLILLAVIAVYAPHLNNGFIFDDHEQISLNPFVQGKLPWTIAFTQGVWDHTKSEKGSSNKYYRPFFISAYRIVHKLGGGEAWAFHLMNLILHLVAILLALKVLTKLNLAPMTSLAATALFALHPMAGETVYWAGCTSELLMQIGLLLTFTGILDAHKNRSPSNIFFIIVGITGLIIGLFSKETAVVIAPILTLEVLRHNRQEWPKRLVFVTPLWLVTLGYLWLRSQFVATDLGAPLPGGIDNIGHFGSALAWYAKQFLIPYPLTPLHNFSIYHDNAHVYGGLLILIILLIVTILFFLFRPEGVFWVGWSFLPLFIPLLPLLFSNRQVTGPLAERYIYLTLVPLCALSAIFVAYLFNKILEGNYRKIAGTSLCFLICFVSGIMVFNYGKAFLNDERYFKRASTYSPNNPFVLQWLAVIELKQKKYRNALSLLNRAIIRDPAMLSLYLNRGFVLSQLGRLPEAEQDLRFLLQKNPEQPGVNFRLANVLNDLGRIDEAAYHYREEIKINQNNSAAMDNLAIYLYQKNNKSEAIELWEKAVKKEKSPYILFNLGMAYHKLGQRENAETYLLQFLQVANDSYAEQRDLARKWLGK